MSTAKNTLTVAELKSWLANIPDTKEDGDPAEIWVETVRGLSSPVVRVVALNKRGNSSDVLFETDEQAP